MILKAHYLTFLEARNEVQIFQIYETIFSLKKMKFDRTNLILIDQTNTTCYMYRSVIQAYSTLCYVDVMERNMQTRRSKEFPRKRIFLLHILLPMPFVKHSIKFRTTAALERHWAKTKY